MSSTTANKVIGVLTGGGDCPGLNAVIRAVVKAAGRRGWEVLGFNDGYEGLLAPVRYRKLDAANTTGILTLGGTILGTVNKGRFAAKVGAGEVKRIDPEILQAAKQTCDELNIAGLVCIGGDGSLTIAQQLFEVGVPVVGVPKTIDNDLEATVATFGFDSAVVSATDALDRLHSTAESHRRVFVLEVMGRHAGWIAVHAGIAGGGDVILIPEIPWTFEGIIHKIEEREKRGRHFTLIVVAEGAKLPGGKMVTRDASATNAEVRLGGIGEYIVEELQRRIVKECRFVVLGHLQRGGPPTSFDRLLATRFGTHAVQLIADGQFGQMVCLRPPDTVSVPITQAIHKLRTVPPDGDVVRTARALGIGFGDD